MGVGDGEVVGQSLGAASGVVVRNLGVVFGVEEKLVLASVRVEVFLLGWVGSQIAPEE